MQPDQYDTMKNASKLIICGTGLIGLATALGLARAGLRPCLLGKKRARPKLPVHAMHPRVYAISPPAQQFLQTLGVWGLLDASRVATVEGMQVRGDAGGRVDLHGWQRMQPALAWILESDALEHALHQALHMWDIAWVEDEFAQIARDREGAPVGVITTCGQTLPAQLIIGADGATSAVRQAAGIACRERDYGQLGLVANLTTALPHQNIAHQWFDHGDILALLPLPDLPAPTLPSATGTRAQPQVSMVWSMNATRAQALLALPAEQRAQRLQTLLAAMTGNALGELTLCSELLHFPLSILQSDMIATALPGSLTQTGVALAGDAAHRVHPLAGQGLNLGLGDAACLMRVLHEKPPPVPLGDASVLRRYRRLRAQPVWAMRTATDGLQRLFASDLPAVVWGRNLGMRCVEHLSWIKQRLIAAAGHN